MKKHILCYGDSNTHGYNSRTGGRFDENTRWPCLLGEKLGSDCLVIEEGLSGRTTVVDDNLNEGLSGLDLLTPVMMSHEPLDLVIIMLGTNDTKERFGLTPENIALGLRRLAVKGLDTHNAWRSAPKILLIAPPPIEKAYRDSSVGGNMGDGCDKKSERLGPLFASVAEELGVSFLDAGTLPGMEIYPYDFMHLSPKGHRVLAEKLAEMVPELL